ncbi:hypothetical protein GCM10016234_33670 [Tianweitania populi]|uniref:DNA-binding response regulator n=2 Tax=Tianweitania populi TaxID=1607949 RepID=A0A8J3DWY5_9HYPH|nr:hypothetical protein GCM10016234_33670 [Tianweitania populi]
MEMVQDLCRIAAKTRILVYSSHSEWTFARRALQAGAKGYVAKSEGLERVATALGMIARNQIYVSEDVRSRLTERGESEASMSVKPNIDALSNRELQILRLVGNGTSSREIADALGLSIKTVATYCERLKVKFKLGAMRDLQALAREHVEGNS